MVLDLVRELGQQFPPKMRVGQLSTAKLDGHLDPVAVLQELDCPSDLRVEVAHTDLRLQADFLELDRPGLPLGFLVPLVQLVLVLPVVEKARHGGRRGRRNLDEVVAALLCQSESIARRHDAELVPLVVGHPNLADPDHLVDTQRPAYRRPRRPFSSFRALVDGVPEHARQRARSAGGEYHMPLVTRRGRQPPPRDEPPGPVSYTHLTLPTIYS